MNQLASNIDTREKTAQFLWTGGILLFFVIQAVIWTIAITFTSGDKSHAVVAGYEEQAMKWDEQVAAQAKSEKLGWTANIVVDKAGDVLSAHEFAIQILDRAGEPVPGAQLELVAFHRGAAGDPQSIDLIETAPGSYGGQITVRKNGYWQFDGRATKGESVYLIHETQFLQVRK